jgi:CyaY protein
MSQLKAEARGYLMDETQFHRAVDGVFTWLETALDASDCGLDYDTAGGILTIEGPHGKVILSRQPPLKELWVAAKSGGFHFRYAADEWRDTRDGQTLKARLEELLQAISGVDLKIL